jgi:hypothetical protein
MPLPLIATGLLERLAATPVAYLALWCALVALSVTIIVLMRARWGQSRPLQKCAVLSLLVHLVFVCLLMSVRIVVGDGSEHDSGPPIRVRIVDDAAHPMLMATIPPKESARLDAPRLLNPPKPEPPPIKATAENDRSSAEVAEPTKTSPAESGVAESARPQPPAEVPVVADDRPKAPEPTAVESEPEPPASEPTVANHSPGEPAVSPPSPAAAPTPPATPPAAIYALRSAPNRLALVEAQGGNVQTEAAVAAALQWLATAQSPNGSWDADRFGSGRELAVLGHDRHGAGRNADTGISALALLAFLGAGHSHQQGDHQDVVRRGLEFLLRSQATDGSIFGNAELYAQMYCHSMSTFALAEAAAMTGDKRLTPAVSRAVNFSIRAQNTSTGGWRYRAGDTGDTSQLGWQMMALASAERAGLAVPRQTWLGVEQFIHSVRRGNYGGLASYRPDSPASTSMTAEALYCRELLSETIGSQFDERMAHEATGQLLTSLADAERVNLYYWYYGTLALHHRQQESDQAAAAWHAWNDALTSVLLSRQVASGSEAGSWNTDCLWGGYGGRVYTTAMATMCLEVYYRYAPAPKQGPWVATRPQSGEAPH